MRLAPRDIYAEHALAQIPRLLTLLDRNPYSPTYGCFHRDFWLYKTSDFPDAVRQFGAQSLALVYRHDFPGNQYFQNERVRDWAIAALDFWARIQHREGSFDEFYPFERGWVGPSAFTTFSSCQAYQLLRGDMPVDVELRVRRALRRAARFVAAGESEEDHLANHHAMAYLAVWKASLLLKDPELTSSCDELWKSFLSYHVADEGWSVEYDGVDPGYLSATVSFLAKIWRDSQNPELGRVLQESVTYLSHFVYPDGSFAGTLGSRNTQHFYPHGCELLASQFPPAAAVAEAMLRGLRDGNLVPPAIMSDRYVFYRVPEFLEAWLDYSERPSEVPPLPWESRPFQSFFPRSRVFVARGEREHLVANLAKGGAFKLFDTRNRQLQIADSGILVGTDKGRILTSQWIDREYEITSGAWGFRVEGFLHELPSQKVFTPLKGALFRLVLLTLGWSPRLAHWLKGAIRRSLILGARRSRLSFVREVRIGTDGVTIEDRLGGARPGQVTSVRLGADIPVRYVPQSRFFQPQDLVAGGHGLPAEHLADLEREGEVTFTRHWQASARTSAPLKSSSRSRALPQGVYDVEYFEGRLRKRQLIYRLKRRTQEVENALRRHLAGRLRVLVDVGTADALMATELQRRLGIEHCVGLERNLRLLAAGTAPAVTKTQADAQALPIRAEVADAVVATAVLEHVPRPGRLLEEAYRILRPAGLLVLTTPDPGMERIATLLGLLKDSGHQFTFNLPELEELASATGFTVVESRKFMFSPIGFPAEHTIERILGPLGLRLLMANQLVVARRGSSPDAIEHP